MHQEGMPTPMADKAERSWDSHLSAQIHPARKAATFKTTALLARCRQPSEITTFRHLKKAPSEGEKKFF